MATQITKSVLRKAALQYRRLLDNRLFEERNEKLCQNLLAYLNKNEFKRLHTFLPIVKNNEVNVMPILPDLLKSEIRIVISKTDFYSKQMHHFYYERDTVFEENAMGIPEPQNARTADFSEVDLVLVPLLTADKDGSRIGYGGGFYDQLLKESCAKKIGLSLSPLLDEICQIEAWDIRLDKVLTPFEVCF